MSERVTRAHFFLDGMVQGVGMRAYLRSVASKHALDGFARNLPDGRVEAAFEGEKTMIEKALQEIKNGYYKNYIQKIDCTFESPVENFQGFRILM